ncbi:MAG: pyrroline-5-carboxylate reductase [bacterium]|nr:pyrroline-5-carboxylate reductase [bacterium]
MAKFGFIGMGNMGYAILKGLLKQYAPEELLFTDVNEERMKKVSQETGVLYALSNAECANQVKYLVLAVKPQYYNIVLKNIQHVVTPKHIVISIAPGITIDSLKDKLGKDKRIVRAMPNTPALLGEGMTGVSYEDELYTNAEKAVLNGFFRSFGKMEKVEERLMDAVGSLSGCSPAYIYMLIEAMADGGVKYGLPRQKAYDMAAQTVLGSAKMVLETGMHPGELKDMVCSPGGTTIEGVSALEESGFRSAIIKAIDASYEKTMKMKNA